MRLEVNLLKRICNLLLSSISDIFSNFVSLVYIVTKINCKRICNFFKGPKTYLNLFFIYFSEELFVFIVLILPLMFLFFVLQSINLKRQRADLHIKLVRRRWHFLCITHSIGRAFSGGSLLRCYLDGDLVSSERCRSKPVYCFLFEGFL